MYHLILPLQRQEHQQHQEKTTYEYYRNQKEVLFERKVDLITSGLQPRFSKYLRDSGLVSKDNAVVICDYVLAMNTEINPSNNYRQTTIQLLVQLSKFVPSNNYRQTTIQLLVQLSKFV